MGNEGKIAFFALGTSREFGGRIARRLGFDLSPLEEKRFSDGEMKIRPLESCEGRHVFVTHSLFQERDRSIHDKICEVLFLTQTAKDAGACEVTAVLPYLCYARQDRQAALQDPVTTRYLARMLESAGVDRVITMDVHNISAFQNSFRIPVLNISAANSFARCLKERKVSGEVVVVSPDVGGVKRADEFRRICLETFESVQAAYVIKRRVDSVVTEEAFVGDIRGKTAVIVDDMISTGGTVAKAVQACRRQGANSVLVVATHGLFAKGANETLGNLDLDWILVSNCVEPIEALTDSVADRVQRVDVSEIFAEFLRKFAPFPAPSESFSRPYPD